jgi:uncharacterized phage protein gp47/JayE
MTSSYDEDGVTLDRYADILARYVALAEAQWGESIDTSEDEFLGALFRDVALIQAEINEILQSIYDAGSITNATGAALSGKVALIGLTRNAAAYSTTTLQLTATKACTVAAGSLYKTAAGVIFATDSELVFSGAGPDTVAATCTVVGAYNAAIGEVTTIVTSVSGISAVTNTVAATPGRLRETDAELKARHTIAVATSGEESITRIYEAVTEVTGVSAVYAYDNDTDSTHTDGTPAHKIHISAIGGTDAAVAEAIANNKTEGVGTYGATTESVYNATTKQAKDINFNRAIDTPNYIDIVLAKVSGVYPDDGDDQVKAALVAYYSDNISINDNVDYNSLYNPIYSIPGLNVTSLKLGTSPSPSGTSDLTSSPLIHYTLAAGNIGIT